MRFRFSAGRWSTLLFVAWACTPGRSSEVPRVVAAESRDAQIDLRDLREQWALATTAGRKLLRPDLENFLARHRTDPTTAEVRVMLAQVALSERRYGAVREILQPVLDGEAGTVRDEAELVLASLDNAEGRHRSALLRLDPLRGKMLSDSARDQWYRESVVAALEVRRWRLAVESMSDWLSQTGGQSREARAWVLEVLLEVPVPALARLLEGDEQESNANEKEAAARDWLQRQIVEHLSRVAIEAEDPKLARDLLTKGPSWLRATPHGDRLVVLSARAARDARVSGRLLGVVVGGESAEARSRSIRVAAGLADVLGAEGIDGQVRLLPVENRDSTQAALGTLSGLGAGLLIAGVDEKSASQALSFAAEMRVPVISLHPPESSVASPFAFVLGVSREEQLTVARGAFPSATQWVSLSTRSECQGGSRASAASGFFILGQEPCLRQLAHWSADHDGPLVVGLDAAQGPFRAGRLFHYLRAGSFPDALWFQGAASGERPEDWFFVLGRDAARLARAALVTLPSSSVEEQRRVEERHLQVAEALRRVRVDLASSDARGFDETGRLGHSLQVVSSLTEPSAGAVSPGGEQP